MVHKQVKNWLRNRSCHTVKEREVVILRMFCLASKDELIFARSGSESQDLVLIKNNCKSPRFLQEQIPAMTALRWAVQSLRLCADPLPWPQSCLQGESDPSPLALSKHAGQSHSLLQMLETALFSVKWSVLHSICNGNTRSGQQETRISHKTSVPVKFRCVSLVYCSLQGTFRDSPQHHWGTIREAVISRIETDNC